MNLIYIYNRNADAIMNRIRIYIYWFLLAASACANSGEVRIADAGE
jgi:hypothetical protein